MELILSSSRSAHHFELELDDKLKKQTKLVLGSTRLIMSQPEN